MPGRGRVGRQRAGRVSGRRDGRLAYAQLHAHRDRAGKAARFERSGGVEALVLDPERFGSQPRPQAPAADHGRPAFSEGNDGVIRRRQNRGVAPHGGRAVRDFPPSPPLPDAIQVVVRQQRAPAFAEVGGHSRLEPLIAQTALQMRGFWHSVLKSSIGGACFSLPDRVLLPTPYPWLLCLNFPGAQIEICTQPTHFPSSCSLLGTLLR